jgi:hypothetical protein
MVTGWENIHVAVVNEVGSGAIAFDGGNDVGCVFAWSQPFAIEIPGCELALDRCRGRRGIAWWILRGTLHEGPARRHDVVTVLVYKGRDVLIKSHRFHLAGMIAYTIDRAMLARLS